MTTPDSFDVEALRLPKETTKALQDRPSKKPPRHPPGGKFLKGPIPWPWLIRAARLPGQALHVALLLWREVGCRKTRTIPFCLSHAREMRMSRDTARRGLRALEVAELVTIRHRIGQCLEVTLLEALAEPSED